MAKRKSMDKTARELLGPSTVLAAMGRRRQGKSLLATYLCAQAHKAGVRVMHNGPLKFGELLTLETLMGMDDSVQDAVIFIDEIQAYLDSTRGNSIVSYLITQNLVQVGKRRLWLFYTSQDEFMLNRRLKWQTDVVIYVATPNEGKTIRFKAVQQGSILPEGMRKHGTLYRADRFWSLYDTSFRVDAEDALGWSADRIRERQRFQELEQLYQYVCGLARAGHETVTSGQVALGLGRYYGIETTAERVGKMLTSLGVPQKRTNTGRFYDLAGYRAS